MKRLLALLLILFALPCYGADVAQNAVTDGSSTVATSHFLNGYSGTTSYRYTIASILGLKTSVTGNAGTATALAANGANCSAGYAPLGVDASGAAESCWQVTPAAIGAQAALTNPLVAGTMNTGYFCTKNAGTNTIDCNTQYVTPALGGTGVANGANNTITFTGNYTLGLTLSNNTAVTLPTSGTLAVTGGALGTPSFTALNLPSSNADPGTTAGQVRHDSTVTNFTRGAVRWYDGTGIRQFVDLAAATAEGCGDGYSVTYNATDDLWQCTNIAGGSMTYPGAGIGVSTGSAWTTSLTAPSGALVGTTDTQTLSGKTLTIPLIGNGSTGGGYAEFREDTDNGTNYVRVKAPDALGADYVATLPAATGTIALSSTAAYDASTWDASTLVPDQNAVRDYLESKLPSGADGSYGIVLTNNSAKSPTASTDEIYFEANIAKVNQNGTESTFAIGPTAGQVSFTGPTAARAYALPDSAATILYSGGALGTPSSGTLTNATGLPIAGLVASTSTALGVGSVELGHASDTTIARASAGAITVEGVGVALNSTSLAHTAGTIELGAASDTTIARASAGAITVEGVAVLLSGGAAGTPSSLNLTNAVTNSGTSLPGTCTVGNMFLDTDADTNGSLYTCVATNTWKEVDDDGGAGGMATTDIDTSAEINTIVTDNVGTGGYLMFNTAPTVTTSIAPASADGATLGTTAAEFSDLYLAAGGVIYGENDQSNTLTSSSTGWNLNLPLGLYQANDPDVAAEGKMAWDANGDWLRVHDGTNQVAVARKLECHDATVVKPNDLADGTRDAFRMWQNNSGMSFIVTSWTAQSSADNTDLNIETTTNTGGTNATVDAVSITTDGTGLFYASDSTITAGTITNGSIIWLDFDDTDTPDWVSISVCGYYNGDVN